MSRIRKLLVLSGILGAGILAAFPFLRRGDAPPQPVDDSPRSSAPLQLAAESNSAHVNAAIDLSLVGASPEPTSELHPVTPPTLRAEALQTSQEDVFTQSDIAVPTLSEQFPAAITDQLPPANLVPDTVQPVDAAASAYVAANSAVTANPLRSGAVREPLRNATTAASTRRHVVRDGDTLEQLAQRLLGDARYAEAIYDANRDRLPQRDLLPIGVELLIPAVSPPGDE